VTTLIERVEAPSVKAPSSAAEDVDALPVTVIEPRRGWRVVDLAEFWRYRELLYFLVWRDVKVRYKQTALGAAWAILQPLATMAVFSVFLGRLGASGRSPWPYPLFVLAGLIPWTFFAAALTAASQSVVGNQALVTKVYFPRLMIPIGAVGAAVVDLGISLVLLVVLAAVFGVIPGVGVILAIPILATLMLAAIGFGTLLAALTVTYRDFRHVVPFLVQFWMFATPTIYMDAGAAIGPRWLGVLPLNPAYGLIKGFRAAMLGGPIDAYALCVSAAVSLVVLMLGMAYFRRVEAGFADVI
jgi:lipopolysaccharide transport system permease protein